MRRILVLAGEIVPHPGLPTVGGGLRGWTLARGLEAAGFDIALAFPREPLDAIRDTLDPAIYEAALAHTFDYADPQDAIERCQPDAVVCCSWLLAAQLGSCPVPLAVDVAGPVLLEFLYQGIDKARDLAPKKPRGLALADFVTCAGERQRAYFYAWLALAGFTPDDLATRVATLPISAAPPGDTTPTFPANPEPTIIFAGIALPWQDPVAPLRATIAALEQAGQGQLDIYLNEHLVHSRGTTWLSWLRDQAASHPRVVLHHSNLRPYAELLDIYRRADLAFDLFAPNPERELAFNTRTVDYLACGLPPLYGDYAELAAPIRDYDAGIVADPTDEPAVTAAVTRALTDPTWLAAKRSGALRLAAERLAWDRTIAPLAAWCANPTRRPTRALDMTLIDSVDLAWVNEERDRALALAAEREAYSANLETAWNEQGAQLRALETTLATTQHYPWRTAIRQTLGSLRSRLKPRQG
ncbi:MAG: glycosyltransferase family 4 protein [Thermomicrobiales bacterium]